MVRYVTMLEDWREPLQEIEQKAENTEFVRAAAKTMAREMGVAMEKGYRVVKRPPPLYD